MAIIKEYMLGQCLVRIHDDFMAKTQEERDKVERDFSEAYIKMVERQVAEISKEAT